MTVTDEAKLFAIRTQLLEMRFKLDASIKIINYVFERSPNTSEVVCSLHHSDDTNLSDPVNGLYPGQIQSEETPCEKQKVQEECLE